VDALASVIYEIERLAADYKGLTYETFFIPPERYPSLCSSLLLSPVSYPSLHPPSLISFVCSSLFSRRLEDLLAPFIPLSKVAELIDQKQKTIRWRDVDYEISELAPDLTMDDIPPQLRVDSLKDIAELVPALLLPLPALCPLPSPFPSPLSLFSPLPLFLSLTRFSE
jgi:hypothetical protein